MPDIKYTVERFRDCIEEIKPLLDLHYDEVAMYQAKIELNPDYDRYLALDDAEMIHVVTAREGELLIGYFITFLVPHMHYQDHIYAVNDVVFIEERYRNAKVGMELFTFAEKELKGMGVSVLVIHMKTKLPFDELCLGLGYDYAERNYTKYIGD
jgi:GNAT superfamily N-acetyltransferase